MDASPSLQLIGAWSRAASDAAPSAAAVPLTRQLRIQDHLRREITPKRTTVLLTLIALSMATERFCPPEFGIAAADRWKPYVVVDSICMGILLIADGFPPEAVLLALTVVYVLAGIITEGEAFAGFSSPGVLAFGALFVLSEAFAEVKVLDAIISRCLGSPRTLLAAQFRITIPVAVLSAFFNNGPLVAMLVPIVQAWAQRHGHSAAQLLMPLAFASTLGGTLTIIGSAANLLAHDRARALDPPVTIGFFDLTPYAAPLGLLGLCYMLIAGPRLLPHSGDAQPARLSSKQTQSGDEEVVPDVEQDQLRRYRILFVVRSRCPSIGCSLYDMGLTRLPDVLVLEIRRHGEALPDTFGTPLCAGDLVKMSASAASIARLRKSYDGLEPAVHKDLATLGPHRRHRRLFEAVVAANSALVTEPLVKQKERLLHKAGSVILAVRASSSDAAADVEARNPSQLAQGDVLLLEAFPDTLDRLPDFSVIAAVESSKPPRRGRQQDRLRGLLCLGGFILAIGLNGFGFLPLATAILALDFFCCCAKVLSWREAMLGVNGSVMMTIAASFGISAAMTRTGAAAALANALLNVGLHSGPFGVLCMVYAGTALLTNIISNTATCVMMIPVAVHVAKQLQQSEGCEAIDEKTLLFLVIFAANASFATPLGSPSNILVVDAGNYTFSDFVRFGGMLQIIMMWATCTALYFFPCSAS
ncbi:SAC1 [Symbiodinium necroappetens]|uniref:SAC1 protein n=1 Tax=Symbiodinium necroappetens TaxID=1628268 RepID=A0A813AMT2_9DINO|nr:SAC1 [Symbiodinium necroappetens]